MAMPQIAALAAAFALLAGLLAFSAKWKVRPWVVLLAGGTGVAFALLMGLLLRKVGSLANLAAGFLLIVLTGLLLCVAVFMFSQRVARKAPDRGNVYRPAHAVRRVAGPAEDPLEGLTLAQVSETALLSEKAPAKPALRLVKPEENEIPDASTEPDATLAADTPKPDKPDPTDLPEPDAASSALDDELMKLEEGFRLEQERLAREEEKRRAREQAAKERRERREEERRMKEEQIREADEAQKVRERIRQERERVAEQDRLRLTPTQPAPLPAEVSAEAAQAPASGAVPAEETWEQEQRRLERELEERRREQEKAAEAEKLWLMEQERLAREQEEQRLERERREQEEAERREREKQEQARMEAQRRLTAEAKECLRAGASLLSRGQRMEALPVLEKAARMDVPNDVKVRANLMILETLAELGWKAEALKRMQAMRSSLAIDSETKKRLGGLATKLLG